MNPYGQGSGSSPTYNTFNQNHGLQSQTQHPNPNQNPAQIPRSAQSPATGAEGLPTPFEHQHSYPQHSQAMSQPLPLPSAITQPPSDTHVSIKTESPSFVNYSPNRQFQLPSVHDQGLGAQGQRHYEQAAPQQPYSPVSHHAQQYGMASHLRPGWAQGPGIHAPMMAPQQPPMMTPHQQHMMGGHPSPLGHPHNIMYTAGHNFAGHSYFAPPAPPMDRPFKCEQCRAAFSRNHDLKRHKRIHLAVKPFPCDYCDKTFTRKDALKRHRLVKGCETKARQIKDGKDVSADGEQRTPPETP